MIPFTQPALTGNERIYVNEALDSGWISGVGSFVGRFENDLADRVGVKHVVAVSNGTLALEVILQTLGVERGDEVIVPALTFAAPAAAARRLGATVYLADIHPDTLTIDPASVEKHLSKHTSAIIAVDLLGNPCDYDELSKFGIPIVEDAAEAHGALLNGRMCGSFGVAAAMSFHANKVITTGEGGAILTNWDLFATKARKIANHGMLHPYYHDVVGTNARMNNLTAAIGVAQIEQWDQHIQNRRRVFDMYNDAFRAMPRAYNTPNAPWVYCVESDSRDVVIAALEKRAINARPIFTPLCNLPPYQNTSVHDCPVARRIGERLIMLPTYESLSESEVALIVETVMEASE